MIILAVDFFSNGTAHITATEGGICLYDNVVGIVTNMSEAVAVIRQSLEIRSTKLCIDESRWR